MASTCAIIIARASYILSKKMFIADIKSADLTRHAICSRTLLYRNNLLILNTFKFSIYDELSQSKVREIGLREENANITGNLL